MKDTKIHKKGNKILNPMKEKIKEYRNLLNNLGNLTLDEKKRYQELLVFFWEDYQRALHDNKLMTEREEKIRKILE